MKAFTTIGMATVAVGVVAAAWAADHATASAARAVAPLVAPPVEGAAKGKVKFEGKAPETKPLTITADQAKGCCPPGKEVDMRDPSIVIGADGGIANVVVTVAVDGAENKPAAEPLQIDQKECHFEPHIQVVPVGGKVVFLNSDQVSHNVHTYASKNDSFNETIAPGGKKEQTLAKSEKIEIKCDIHPWMNSWIFVSDTPHYAITKEDGSFEIKGLKPGTHKAELWHEKFGKGKGEIVIKEDGSSEMVEFKMGEKKKKS